MKRKAKFIVKVVFFVAACAFCGGISFAHRRATKGGHYSDDHVIDHKNHDLGEEACPDWLYDLLTKGDETLIRKKYDCPADSTLYIGISDAKDLEAATLYAKQATIACSDYYVAHNIHPQKKAPHHVSTSPHDGEHTVITNGFMQVCDFWQKVSSESGEKYIVYVIYQKQ